LKPGQPAPLFSCPLLSEGTEQKNILLTDLLKDGQVTVLSFFHTTCKPCIKEIPRLSKVVSDLGNEPVKTYLVFVGREDDDTVQAFLDKYKFTLPVLMDRYGIRLGERYGVVKYEIAVVPQVMVISKNGVMRAVWRGFREGMDAKLKTLLASLVKEKKTAPVVGDTVTILFTNNTNGMTLPGPTGMGGLARRATVFKKERAANPATIVVDAGDFFPTSPNKERTGKIVSAYRRLGYDAITIGEGEFVNGLQFLRSLVDKKKLPFVSANVKICQKTICVDLVQPHKVLTVGKRKVAIYAYMHPKSVGFTPKSRFKHKKWYVQFTDPLPPLKSFLRRFRKKSDLIVVLSHAGVERDRELAREIQGIDVIVGGHSQTFLRKPVREAGTTIVQAASDGQYVGKLVIRFSATGKPLVVLYKLIALNEQVKKDRAMTTLLSSSRKP